MAVVVLDIEVQDAKKLPTPSDQELIQTLPVHGAAQRSATALAFGA
jgi:hypothetical protein